MGQGADEFEVWFVNNSPRLHSALVASYGPNDGRAAAADALGWAWEHWDRVRTMANPLGYLYRVGQSASRRYRIRPIPVDGRPVLDDLPDVDPELHRALAGLSRQQRSVVLLVHGFGWTIRGVAEVLEVSPGTVQSHLERAMGRLRVEMEQRDAH